MSKRISVRIRKFFDRFRVRISTGIAISLLLHVLLLTLRIGYPGLGLPGLTLPFSDKQESAQPIKATIALQSGSPAPAPPPPPAANPPQPKPLEAQSSEKPPTDLPNARVKRAPSKTAQKAARNAKALESTPALARAQRKQGSLPQEDQSSPAPASTQQQVVVATGDHPDSFKVPPPSPDDFRRSVPKTDSTPMPPQPTPTPAPPAIALQTPKQTIEQAQEPTPAVEKPADTQSYEHPDEAKAKEIAPPDETKDVTMEPGEKKDGEEVSEQDKERKKIEEETAQRAADEETRKREEQRKAEELAKAEAARQEAVKKQAELAAQQAAAAASRREAELKQQQELQAQAREAAARAAAEQQARKEAEAAKAFAEKQAAEKQAEIARQEALRKQEAEKQAELARQEEARKKAEEQQLEEKRKEAEIAAQKKAEEERQKALAAEQQRQAEQAARDKALAAERQRQEEAATKRAQELAQQKADADAAAQREAARAAAAAATAAARTNQQSGNGVASANAGNPGNAANGTGSGNGQGSGKGKGSQPIGGNTGSVISNALSQIKGLDTTLPPPPGESERNNTRNEPDQSFFAPYNDVQLDAYISGWRTKIENNGDFNYSQLKAEQVREDPVVTVWINSDGSVKHIYFNRRSGRSEIDDAVIRIINVRAPYSVFPPAMAKKYDSIPIRRIWNFGETLRLIEEVR